MCATSGLIVAVQELGSLGIKLAGNDEQKQRFLPKLAIGRVARGVRADRARLGLRQRGDAHDGAARRRRVRAERRQALHHERRRRVGVRRLREDRSGRAATAASRAFVVEADAPGFEVGRIEPKMGIKGSTTGELFFNDCRIPAANLLGEEGEGFKHRDAHPRPLAARASARRGSGSRRARPTTRSSTRARARRWASRSRSTS